MSWRDCCLEELIELHDQRRIPLSGVEREKRQGEFRYYGAQGVIDHIDAYIFDGEYVLVAEDGENLRSRKQPIAQIVSGQFWVNNHAHILRAKDCVSNNAFICALLNWIDISPFVTGAAQPKLSQGSLKSIKVKVPDVDIQLQIAVVLSAYDDLITTNQRRIALLEDAAHRLYREWFVHLRFPGHESVPVKDGVPEGWERGSLDSALFLQRGFDLPNGSRIPGDVPVYASTGINGFHNEAKAVCPGVVTGRSGTLGQVHYVTKDYWPLNTSLWVKEFRRVSPILAYFLLSELKLEQFNSGASVPTLDRKTVHQASVLVPSPEVVTQFDALVQPLFDQIEMLKSSIATNAQARDLLLPKLMSGQLDVSGIALPDEVAA